MNKIYKVVFNHATGLWSVVSELAKGKGKSSTQKHIALTFLALTLSQSALAEAQIATGTDGIVIYNSNDPSIRGTNQGAEATHQTAIAIGNRAQAKDTNAVAIGRYSNAEKVNTVAIGNAAKASAQQATAIGSTAQVIGITSTDSIAIGTKTTINASTGEHASQGSSNSVAIGSNASITGEKSVAIGYKANVIGTSAEKTSGIAIGDTATVNGQNSMAIGHWAKAIATGNGSALALGDQAKALNEYAVAMGTRANASSYGSVSIAYNATASSKNSIALGTDAKAGVDAQNYGEIAIGNRANASGKRALAMGIDSTAKGEKSTVIGELATSEEGASEAISLGYKANVSKEGASALGRFSTASGKNSLALASNATASGENTIANGFQSNASASNATAIGTGSRAEAASSIAIGESARASSDAENGIALGKDTKAYAKDTIAIGTGARANTNATNAIAIGTGSEALGENSISIGTGNKVTAKDAGALGDPSIIAGAGSYGVGNDNAIGSQSTNTGAFGNNNQIGAKATYDGSKLDPSAGLTGETDASGSRVVGNNNTVTAQNSFVLGNNVTADVANSVFLGNASAYYGKGAISDGIGEVSDAKIERFGGGTIDYSKYYFSGKDATGVVSVGGLGNERRIINVAAGLISAESTDAINGSQLYHLLKTTPLEVDDTGKVKEPTGDAANALMTAGDIANAINNAGFSLKTTASNGGTVITETKHPVTGVVTNSTGVAGNQFVKPGSTITLDAGKNITLTNKADGSISISTPEIVSHTTVISNTYVTQTGYAGLSDAGLTIGGNTYITPSGIDANHQNVINVKPAEISPTSLEAVNGAQLYYTQEALSEKLHQGAAVAGAMAMLPQPHLSGKSLIGVGAVTYRGQPAVAIGYSALSDNSQHIIKVSGSVNAKGKKHPMVGVSYGYQW